MSNNRSISFSEFLNTCNFLCDNNPNTFYSFNQYSPSEIKLIELLNSNQSEYIKVNYYRFNIEPILFSWILYQAITQYNINILLISTYPAYQFNYLMNFIKTNGLNYLMTGSGYDSLDIDSLSFFNHSTIYISSAPIGITSDILILKEVHFSILLDHGPALKTCCKGKILDFNYFDSNPRNYFGINHSTNLE